MPRITSITTQAITGIGKLHDPVIPPIEELASWSLANPNSFSTSASDRFAHSVAISDSYVAISARDEDSVTGTNIGAVYVRNRGDGSAVNVGQEAYGASVSNNANFGNDIALTDDRLVVGAPSDTNSSPAGGRVHVFDPASGTQLFTLTNPNTYVSNSDSFGFAVAVSQSYIAVGAPTEDVVGTNAIDAGTVNVYSAVDGTFLYTKFPDNDFRRRGSFGYSIAMTETDLVIGCRTASGADNFGGGGIVYVCDPSDGTTKYTITNPNIYGTTQNDNFGWDVAVSDSYVIVGVPNEDSSPGPSTGVAYIFDLADGSLLHTLTKPTTAGASDLFGHAVAISDTYAIVTAYLHEELDEFEFSDSGRSYVYHTATGQLISTIINPNLYSQRTQDNFGYSAALLDSKFVLGAIGEDDASGQGSGAAYYYNYDLSLSDRYFAMRLDQDSYTEGSEFTVTTWATPTLEFNTVGFTVSPGDFTLTDSATLGIGAYGRSNDVVLALNQDKANEKISKKFTVTLAANDSGSVATNSLSDSATIKSWILHYDIADPNNYRFPQGDRFGWAVAVSGTTAVVSAPFEDRDGIFVGDDGVDQGTIYIYDIITGTITATLDSFSQYGTTSGDNWGTSVAISDTYIAVGGPKEETTEAQATGAVNIYLIDGTPTRLINNPVNNIANSLFGQSIDINGENILIGCPGHGEGGLALSGLAYVYSITTGSLISTLAHPTATFGDRFGQAVALQGNYAVVGCPYRNNFANPGEVLVFDASAGTLLYTLTSDLQNGDQFGFAVDTSASYIAVGAPRYDSPTTFRDDTGRAYVYDITNGELVQVFNNPDILNSANGDNFGYSISISGNYLYVGAPYEDFNTFTGVNAGRVYVFDIITGDLLRTITNPNPTATNGGVFGHSISANGDWLVVGAPDEGTNVNSGTVTMQSGDFSNGFSSEGVSSSYLLTALPAGIYTFNLSNITLTGGIGACFLLSTNQNALDNGDPGVFYSYCLADSSPGPKNVSLSGINAYEPFYVIFDASTGELTATGVSYSGVQQLSLSGRSMFYKLGTNYAGSWEQDANTALILEFNDGSQLTADGSLNTATVATSGIVAQIDDNYRIMRGGANVSRGYLQITGGSSSYLNFSSWNIMASLTTWQIEGWFRIQGSPNPDFYLCALGTAFVCKFNTDGTVIIDADGLLNQAGGTAWNDGAVHYFTVKRALNSQPLLYIDGTAYSKAGSDFGSSTFISSVRIGQTDDTGNGDTMFLAVVDGIRISKTDRGYTTFDKTQYYSAAAVYGLVTNGGFANEAGWTVTASTVTFSGGTANFNSFGTITQDIEIAAAGTYAWTVTVTAFSGDTMFFRVQGADQSVFEFISSAGTYSGTFTHSGAATTATVQINGNGDGSTTFSVDNVAVRRLG